MQSSALKKFVKLRRALVAEQAELTARLEAINAALADSPAAPPAAAAPRAVRAARQPRVQNALSLKEAILQVIKGKAMTKEDVHSAIVGIGYAFRTGNPLNSIGTVLYGKKPRFKNDGGTFSLA